MPRNEKTPTEEEFTAWVRKGWITLPPVRLELLEAEPAGSPGRRLDALIRLHWKAVTHDFAVEYRRRGTPQALQEAIQKVLTGDRPSGMSPMVVVPYLAESHLEVLQQAGVSGIDLCGNGVVSVPGRLLIYRTGQPNRFPHSAPIKNIYRGVSSAVARVFLLEPRFETVTQIRDAVHQHGVDVSLPTVSKVLKALQEELVVSRGAGEIRLLQPDKLLERLAGSFKGVEIRRYLHAKVPYGRSELLRRLNEQAVLQQLDWTLTGVGSAPRYSVMATANLLSLYCTDLDRLLTGMEVRETEHFANLEVVETRDPVAYFDRRWEEGCPWSSPIQTYLELLRGGKREQETAEQVRRVLLAGKEQRSHGQEGP